MTIDILPNDVLLLIFHFDLLEDRATFPYLDGLGDLNGRDDYYKVEDDGLLLLSWHRLVHVCRRWRSVVFASSNFLDLRLVCDARTRVELTGIWPRIPITIRTTVNWPIPEDYDFDAAMVHPNRVREIRLLDLTDSLLQRLASVMQQEFPALIHLKLGQSPSYSIGAPDIPDGFLGGSAPLLQSLMLCYISFPAISNLLLSATSLVHLTLWEVPWSASGSEYLSDSGCFSAEVIVTGLAALTNLKSLTIGSDFFPDLEHQHSLPTRTFLPALIHFEFRGVSSYLENLVARIDAPLLNSFITFLFRLIFDVPQLAQFMKRTTKFQALNEAHVDIDDYASRVDSFPPTQTFDKMSRFSISFEFAESPWPYEPAAQILTSFFPSLYIVEHLYIYGSRYFTEYGEYGLDIFHPFTFAKNVYVSKEFVRGIIPALQDLVEEGVAGVLPALETLFLEKLQPLGPVWDVIEQFVAARQPLGHPMAISYWNRT